MVTQTVTEETARIVRVERATALRPEQKTHRDSITRIVEEIAGDDPDTRHDRHYVGPFADRLARDAPEAHVPLSELPIADIDDHYEPDAKLMAELIYHTAVVDGLETAVEAIEGDGLNEAAVHDRSEEILADLDESETTVRGALDEAGVESDDVRDLPLESIEENARLHGHKAAQRLVLMEYFGAGGVELKDIARSERYENGRVVIRGSPGGVVVIGPLDTDKLRALGDTFHEAARDGDSPGVRT